MKQDQLYDVWWKERYEGEQRMEDEHVRHWEKVLGTIVEEDIQNCAVLDFGCNQGGFLRYLYGKRPFREGIGIDLARQSIAVANERKGDAPLYYEATGSPEEFPHRFDLAFSISVMYLIADLEEHTRKIRQALKPGGVYYATYTDYRDNPSLPHIQAKINENGALPMNLHTLDDISKPFMQAGFQVGIQRMKPESFIAISPNERWFLQVADRIQYEYEQAYIFRFVAPDQA
ncbi:class I SAM-dependent methyltransferase [Paenibacillus sedimenti]|uniref:Class I SAM-dependent methyltransferase n=1 Tax=Paenibacillus sedimenti TaxID=2770274 RepID=A0A926KWM6_9BACL|nr:class I SAM-dependent methyltransferase [Paenibacillus sedimenti]MBD0384231.1 class I SAM-dependent methyltransferase [Paenibacillus sedimenti]